VSMRRPSRIAVAAVTLAAAGGGSLSGCGSDGEGIPPARATDLKAQLDSVASAVAAGNCDGAAQAVARARGAVLNLPADVDQDLRDRLEQGVDNLDERVPAACGATDAGQGEEQPTTTQQEGTDTGETDTQRTDTQGTDTTPTDTQPTDTTPTQTQPTQTQPTTPTTPGQTAPDTGGAAPDSGAGE
jgi:hypothetical protein